MAENNNRTARPFKYRGGWRLQLTLANGMRPAKTFEKFTDAVAWGNEQLANANTEHAPALGGPTQATMAQALDYYARRFTVSKEGVDQELTRINQYLEASDLPLLKASRKDNGGVEIVPAVKSAIRPEFAAHVQRRRQKRAGTYAFKHKLALMKCSRISSSVIQDFYVQMINDGLSDSSIQKEVALLKAFFNSTPRMNWIGVDNPCNGIKLGKSQRRFVHLTEQQQTTLMRELMQCDNPYFLPLVLTAKETTLRLDTLVKMTWSNTSVENRTALLPTKTGQRAYVLSREVQTILAGLPQSPGGPIFPMSKSAINSTWDRVRQRCGLTQLQFRDLRHLGATDWVRRGLNAHQLKQVLGHSGIATAQLYVDLVGKDLEEALDRASGNAGVMVLPPDFPDDPQAHLNARRAARLNKKNVTELEVATTNVEQHAPVPAAEPEFGSLQAMAQAHETKQSNNVICITRFKRKTA